MKDSITMKVTLLIVSDSDKHFSSAVDEYIKRLSKSVTILTIKPTKHGSVDQIIASETQSVIKKLKPGVTTIVLNPEGVTWATTQRKSTVWGQHTQIVIGGPYGLDYTQFPSATHISLWSQTMPHGLVKLVILEQLYRARCIWQWKKYHY